MTLLARSQTGLRLFGGFISKPSACENLSSRAIQVDISSIRRAYQLETARLCPVINKQGSLRSVNGINGILDKIDSKSPLMNEMLQAARIHFQNYPYRNIWVGVSQAALEHNVQQLRKMSRGKKLCGVVKCDAYGHSIRLVAPVLAPHVDVFGVTENQEAEVLKQVLIRQGCESRPVMRVRLADDFEITSAIAEGLGIQELVGSYEQAMVIAKAVDEYRSSPADIHLSIDATGMGRDGFSIDEAQWLQSLEMVKNISRHPALNVVGLSTHLPRADDSNYADTTHAMIRFAKACEIFRTILPNQVDIHAFASAGTLRMAELPQSVQSTITMNRAGAALFGQESYAGEDTSRLRQVMTVCTFVSGVFNRAHASTVGYGSHYKVTASQEMHANVPGGWNLFPRELLKGQNRDDGIAPLHVMNQHGGRHLIIGNPSMNTVVCRADSEDGSHQLRRMEPVLYLAERQTLPNISFQDSRFQDSNSLSRLISSTAARLSIQLGNPQYVAHMLINKTK